MARRTDHSREQLYEMALAASARIVAADGHRALTARNVADAIGYSPGTLYNIFENLDDLILHLNARLLDEMHEALAALPTAGHPREDLHRLLDAYLRFIAARANLWALLFEHSLPQGRTAPDWYHRKVEKVLAVLEAALAPAFPARRRRQAGRAARILWASLHGIWSLGSSGKLALVSRDGARAMAATLIDTYLAGLAAQQGEHA